MTAYWIARGGCGKLNSFRVSLKWFSALVMPPPLRASAGWSRPDRAFSRQATNVDGGCCGMRVRGHHRRFCLRCAGAVRHRCARRHPRCRAARIDHLHPARGDPSIKLRVVKRGLCAAQARMQPALPGPEAGLSYQRDNTPVFRRHGLFQRAQKHLTRHHVDVQIGALRCGLSRRITVGVRFLWNNRTSDPVLGCSTLIFERQVTKMIVASAAEFLFSGILRCHGVKHKKHSRWNGCSYSMP